MAEILTERQIAERYRIPVAWLKAQVKAGAIPHLRAGRRVLLNPVAVAEALSNLAAQYPTETSTRG